MRLPRHRRTPLRSAERPRRRSNFSYPERNAAVSRRSITLFASGVLLTVFLWGLLQRSGLPGPWTNLVWSNPSGSRERLGWLRARKEYLISQLALADSQLAARNVVKHINQAGLSEDEVASLIGGAGVMTGGASSARGRNHSAQRQHQQWQQERSEGVDERREGGWSGVKAEGHFILGLSDEAFGSTPVDEMMAQYDTKKCDESFGNGLVDLWRNSGTECCRGDGGRQGGGMSDGSLSASTSIRCHLIRQDGHHGNGDNLVHMTNVQVDLGEFKDPGVARRVMQAYKQSKHSKQAYVELQRGAIKGTCTPEPSSWKDMLFPGWNADWTTRAFQAVRELQCDRWVDHPVMVVQRDTFANLFHDSEDFVNAFLAMAILRKRLGETQILLTDLYPKGPFWAMWDKVFGVGQPTWTAWDVGLSYGEGKVCFRDLTVGIFGPAAPTTLAASVTSCFHTALVRAYSDFVIRGLGLQGFTRYASPPSRKVVVTWVARRSSVQWPERAYCSEDGKGSFFTCDFFSHLDMRELQRKVKNEAEVVRSLKMLEGEVFGNGAMVEVRDVDYNLLSFEEQIKNDLRTDIMVGPHGAGLFHIIFTPDRASLIELQIDQTTARKHFNNLSKWSGHGYRSKGGPNPVNVGDTQAMVRQAIGGLDLSKH